MPITIATIGETYPAAGVIATSPATRPDATPSIVTFRIRAPSTNDHVSAPAAAARCVLTSASAAWPFAPGAEPALKPNQPNHRMPAPMTVIVRSCGGWRTDGYPRRLPSTTAATSAD